MVYVLALMNKIIKIAHFHLFLSCILHMLSFEKVNCSHFVTSMMHFFHRCHNGLASLDSLYPCPNDPPTHEDILVQKETINTYFKTLPSKDEFLRKNFDLSPKMFLSHESILEQEDDIINIFLNVTLPFIYGTSPREQVLMDIDLSPPNFGPTNEGILVQEEVMRTFFKDLPSMSESLRNDVYPKMYVPHEDHLV